MALRDDLLGTVDSARALVDGLGLRRHVVTVRRRAWSGATVGEGTFTDTDLVLSPTPKVTKPRPALGGPDAQTPTWFARVVSKISATYTAAQLSPSDLAANEQLLWMLDDERFWLTDPPEERNFAWRAKVYALPYPRETATVSTATATRTDPVLGTADDTLDSRTVELHVAAVDGADAAAFAGQYQVGDVRIVLMACDLTADPGPTTRITLASGTHRVVQAHRDAHGIAWTLLARRVA